MEAQIEDIKLKEIFTNSKVIALVVQVQTKKKLSYCYEIPA